MTDERMVESIAEKTGIEPTVVKTVLDAYFEEVVDTVTHQPTGWAGFGVFTVDMNPRRGPALVFNAAARTVDRIVKLSGWDEGYGKATAAPPENAGWDEGYS